MSLHGYADWVRRKLTVKGRPRREGGRDMPLESQFALIDYINTVAGEVNLLRKRVTELENRK